MTTNTVTEQLTEAGRAIEHDSFAVIDAEAGPHNYSAEQWPLVRRMIHAQRNFVIQGRWADNSHDVGSRREDSCGSL